MSLEARIEALLFASDRPLSVRALTRVLAPKGEYDRGEIAEIVRGLVARYEERQGGFVLMEVAGGFEFRTRECYASDVLRLYDRRPARLSQASMETLAIVAFRQPCTRALIDELRGVDSSGCVRNLLERELVVMAGRSQVPGRPHLFRTTPTFLRVFGMRSLKDLPDAGEIGEITAEHVLRLEDYQRQGELSVETWEDVE